MHLKIINKDDKGNCFLVVFILTYLFRNTNKGADN